MKYVPVGNWQSITVHSGPRWPGIGPVARRNSAKGCVYGLVDALLSAIA